MPSVTIRWGSNNIPERERSVTTMDFKTQAEVDAYMQGVDDMDGWADYEIIEEEVESKLEADDLWNVPITP